MSDTTVSENKDPVDNAAAVIAAINGAATILEILLPLVQKYVQSGEITVEQQAQLLAKIEAMRPTPTNDPFNAPHWKLSTDK